jgi:hypothetical protein
MTIADYSKGLHDQSIVVNRDYQRSNRVWPTTAQSFLIESILLGYPVPKLALYQVTDRETRTTQRELVDGQQRTEAIVQFFDNKLRLSRTLEFNEAAGRLYDQLSPELQDQFLAYDLGFDLFVDASPKEIRETFRRVNAYETPLNGEEQRYARYQGDFKWFIYRLSKTYDDTFKVFGTFGERQLARMADMKLLTEVVHAMVFGIKTTTKRDLDHIYDAFDEAFTEADQFTLWLDEAILLLVDLEEIHGTALTKPFSLYALLLALIHCQHDLEPLREFVPGGRGLADRQSIARGLAELAEVLESEPEAVPAAYQAFSRASDKGTNVKDARETRVRFYCDAVAPPD